MNTSFYDPSNDAPTHEMKLLSKNLALCFSFLFLKNVSCSISAECKTGKTVVLEKFTTDTTELFKKLSEIRSCGEQNFGASNVLKSTNYNGYKTCISKLGIPESYEAAVAKLGSHSFTNDYEFRKAIRSAATSLCKDLNFENFHAPNDTVVKSYKVTSVYTSDELETSKMSESNYSNTHTETESSFFTYGFYVFWGFILMVVIMLSVFFLCFRLNRDVIPNKHELHITRDLPHEPLSILQMQENSQNYLSPIDYNFQQISLSLSANIAPPSYYEANQGYSVANSYTDIGHKN